MKLHFVLDSFENHYDESTQLNMRIQTVEADTMISPVVCVFTGVIRHSDLFAIKHLTNCIMSDGEMKDASAVYDMTYEFFVDLIEKIVAPAKISEWGVNRKHVFNDNKEELARSFASALFRVQPEPPKLTQSDVMAAAWGLTHLSRAKRLKVGAVALDACGRAVGYGYNHMPFKHRTQCCELDANTSSPEVIHAEMDALVQGENMNLETMFVTHAPCLDCAMAIAEAGIKKVVYEVPYRLTNGIDYLIANGIEVVKYDGDDGSEPTSAYVNQ